MVDTNQIRCPQCATLYGAPGGLLSPLRSACGASGPAAVYRAASGTYSRRPFCGGAYPYRSGFGGLCTARTCVRGGAGLPTVAALRPCSCSNGASGF